MHSWPSLAIHYTLITDTYKLNPTSDSPDDLLEHAEPPYHPVYARSEILVVDTVVLRIHVHQRVPDNVFEEWSGVYLTQYESKGIGRGIAEHDELVSR